MMRPGDDVKKVTASRHEDIVPGSSRAEINVRRNMMRNTVVKKVTASSHDIVHEQSSSTEINAMTNMMPTTIVKKDTASHDIVLHGSSRTNINAMTNVMPSLVVNMVTTTATSQHVMVHGSSGTAINMPKRGYQHTYKSSNTSTSRRVDAAYKASVCHGAPQSKLAIRRDKAKMKKVHSLNAVSSSPIHSLK